MDNFLVQIEQRRLPVDNASMRELLIGKRVIVLHNTNSHSYGNTGDEFTVGSYVTVGRGQMSAASEDGGGNNIKFKDIHIVFEDTIVDIKKANDDLTTKISELKDLIKSNIDKVEFIKFSNTERFDDVLFRGFKLVKNLSPDMSDDDAIVKAKELVEEGVIR